MQNAKKNNVGLSFSQKIIIVCLMFVIVLLLGGYALGRSNNTRTIMMYIVGSNLESESSIVTADLDSLDVNKIDLEHTNILIYTGGTKKWHNFIRNDENAIYLLTKKGFKKIESYEQKNMGDSKTFSDFLNYGYNNFKADKYDLIMYDHGGAIAGAIYDDFTGDNLDLYDFSKALKDSPFNKKNKMETVIFRTCLNGTVEVGSVFSDYAKYLVASEEITWGSPASNVLGFLNNVSYKDDGVTFGKKFINQYDEQMKYIDSFGTKVMTYAIIDLTNINNVIKELNDYVQSIDLQSKYTSISTIRSNVYQYGSSQAEDFDMVDLYDFVSRLDEDNNNVKKLLSEIDKTVIYNKTNNQYSHGLSVYFPYKGQKDAKKIFLDLYNRMNSFKNYSSFITKFNALKDGGQSFSFNFKNNESNVSSGEVSLKLNDEQRNHFANALYIVVKKDKKLKDFYELIYSSDDILYKDGKITTKISNNLIKISDKSAPNEEAEFVPSRKRINGSDNTHTLNAILYDMNKDVLDVNSFMLRATISIVEKSGSPTFSTVVRNSSDSKLDGMLLNINDFEVLDFPKTRVKLLDKNNKVIDGDWETSKEVILYEVSTKNIKLEKASLDDGDYYCLFKIFDNNGNSYYSDLIKVN